MATSIICRLGFVISPKPELLPFLQIDSTCEHGLCEATAVITPRLDYEDGFEGWKRAWKSKAKQDFIAETVSLYSEEFPTFIDGLRKLPTDESFDRWWTLSELHVLEINPSWRPS